MYKLYVHTHLNLLCYPFCLYSYHTTFSLQYFAGVSIEDPRLAVMCDKAGLPLPYNVLMECVQRSENHHI